MCTRYEGEIQWNMSQTNNILSPTSWAHWSSCPAGLCQSSSQNWAEGKLGETDITIVANEPENSFIFCTITLFQLFALYQLSIQFRVERANAELPFLKTNWLRAHII